MEIDKIKINKRFRKDLGDIKSLAESIEEVGLLHPIVINQNNELIAGRRRLEAFKLLGRTEIPVTQVILNDIVKGEHDENVIRKDFSPSEAVAIWKAMGKISPPGKIVDNLSTISKTTREQASIVTGLGVATLYRARHVIDNGNEEDIIKMDKTGNVNKVYKEVKNRERLQKINDALSNAKQSQVILKHGDFRDLIKDVPDNSIDLVLTDPPYGEKYLSLWESLACESARVLKPGGFLINYSGQNNLIQILNDVSKHLDYYWLGMLYHKGSTAQRFEVNMWNRAKPILFFNKPPKTKQVIWLEDVLESPHANKDIHEWGQSVEPFKKLVECFSSPGQWILEPFAGGGSVITACIETKRNIIAYEIDDNSYNKLCKNFNL